MKPVSALWHTHPMPKKSKRAKDPAAVALGTKGGLVGGLARVPKGTAMLSQDERTERAKQASAARWGKRGK